MLAANSRTSTRYATARMLLLSCLCLAWVKPAQAMETLHERLEALLVENGLARPGDLERVNIYGDGDPVNGTEDSRIDMTSPLWRDGDHEPWSLAGGTIHCDGKHRGSAVIVDTGDHMDQTAGLVVLTSAHVLFDLSRKKRFSSCKFHYLGLSRLPGYEARVDLSKSRFGAFDPGQDRRAPTFGRDDWALLYITGLRAGVAGPGRARLRPFAELRSAGGSTPNYQFLAYSRSFGGMTISTTCRVIESMPSDLGGGAWAGQLLDDCDSEGGASGGGIFAEVDGEYFVVGIRSGSHWDGQAFPAAMYPSGPPSGALWDPAKNTNFSRAVDGVLLDALADLLNALDPETPKRAP